MPMPSGKRVKVEPQPPLINAVDLSVAVGSYLEKHLEDLKESMNELTSKVELMGTSLENLQIRFNEFTTSAREREGGITADMDQFTVDIKNELTNIADQLKVAFEETVNVHKRTQIEARNATSGTTAEPEVVSSICHYAMGRGRISYFLPASVREALAVETILRGVVRITLRHYHSIKELRNFTLKGCGVEDSEADASGDEEGNIEEPSRVPVPSKTLAIALAVANKCQPISAIVQRTDPHTYARLVSTRQTEVRKSASRIFQYFRNRYDKNGELKPDKRNSKKPSTSSPKIYNKPQVSSIKN